MRQPRVHDAVERINQRACLFGRQVEVECLDRDESILRGFVRAVDRSQDAHPDLMHDAEGTECTGGGKRN